MEPIVMPELEFEERPDEEIIVHEWRAQQLRRLGVPWALADKFAAIVDWHEIAALVERGCSPALAFEIVR
jgi:hypothetical protein